jgi:hypothetical protein
LVQRLLLEWSLDDSANAARLPPLLLQPLVENAVKHGVEPSRNGARSSCQHTAARQHRGDQGQQHRQWRPLARTRLATAWRWPTCASV